MLFLVLSYVAPRFVFYVSLPLVLLVLFFSLKTMSTVTVGGAAATLQLHLPCLMLVIRIYVVCCLKNLGFHAELTFPKRARSIEMLVVF